MTHLAAQPFVVFDLETTGHGASSGHEIVEIGAVRVLDGRVVEHFETIVNPGREIPEFVASIHGITDFMTESAPILEDVMLAPNGFLNFIGADPLVAYNAPFDMSFVHAAFRKFAASKLPNPVVDCLRLARKRFKQLDSHKLAAVAAHVGISYPAHTALGDALMTAGVFNECLLSAIGEGHSEYEDFLTALGIAPNEKTLAFTPPVHVRPIKPVARLSGDIDEY